MDGYRKSIEANVGIDDIVYLVREMQGDGFYFECGNEVDDQPSFTLKKHFFSPHLERVKPLEHWVVTFDYSESCITDEDFCKKVEKSIKDWLLVNGSPYGEPITMIVGWRKDDKT